MVAAQAVSAAVSVYLREVGASQELFEVMSMTLPKDMYIPEPNGLDALGVSPSGSDL